MLKVDFVVQCMVLVLSMPYSINSDVKYVHCLNRNAICSSNWQRLVVAAVLMMKHIDREGMYN